MTALYFSFDNGTNQQNACNAWAASCSETCVDQIFYKYVDVSAFPLFLPVTEYDFTVAGTCYYPATAGDIAANLRDANDVEAHWLGQCASTNEQWGGAPPVPDFSSIVGYLLILYVMGYIGGFTSRIIKRAFEVI